MTRSEAKKIAQHEATYREEVLLRLDSLTWQGKQTVELLGRLTIKLRDETPRSHEELLT